MSLLGITNKGKWVLGGVLTFSIVAATSTAFATWVIGGSTKGSVGGSITAVGTTDGSLSASGTLGATPIKFGPNSVNAGDYVHSSEDASEENLTITLSATVTLGVESAPFNHVDIYLYGTTTEAASAINVAVEANYITLPTIGGVSATGTTVGDFATVGELASAKLSGVKYTIPSSSFSQSGTERTADLDIVFGWGSAFNSKNPSEYFTDSTVKTVGGNQDATTALGALAGINAAGYTLVLDPHSAA